MRLLIVGGGITGLAAAWEAVSQSEPVEVVLVEAEPRLGGKIQTETVAGLLIEHGPDSFVSYRPAALQLAAEVGLADQVISTSGARTVHLRSRGRLRPLPAGMGMVLPNRIWPFVTTGILSPMDKLRAGLDLVLPRQLRDGEDTTIGAFLRTRLGDGIVRRFADPMIGGIYGAGVDELSLDAVLPSLRADEAAHRSLMLAALAQGRQARAAGRGTGSPFRTFSGGLGSLIDALTTRLLEAGADLRVGTAVSSLQADRGGVVARFSDGGSLNADAVVLAGGPASSAALLARVAPAAAAALRAVPLADSTVVSLAYADGASAEAPRSHGWLEADTAPISGITVSSAKWAGRAPQGVTLIRAFVPQRLGAIASAPDEDLLAAVTDHLAAVLGVQAAPVLSRVKRWTAVMPKYTVGHPGRVAAVAEGLAGLPNWRVAGSALRGVGVPDCVQDGRRQAALALRSSADGEG